MIGTLTLALAALSAPVTPSPVPPDPSALIARWVHSTSASRPKINIWTNKEDPYQRGDRARVYFKSETDAHVTVVRIDTDGRMRILFPVDPWEDNWARGGKTFEVLGRDRDEAFRVDDAPGAGYIFAVASDDPFTYDDIIRGDHWDYHTIGDGRVRGDPYVAVADLAERIAGEDGYDYDIAQYDVEKHYDYPRFVCYDCHSYAGWHTWNPYHSSCSHFQIVIYDDWYYYPYRYYYNGYNPGYYNGYYVAHPYNPGPRYVFKDYNPRNDYVTRVAQRPRTTGSDPRRPVEENRTSADVGGRGTVPVPGSPRRRTEGGSTAAPESSTRPVERGGSPQDPSTSTARDPSPGRRGESGQEPGTETSQDRIPGRRAEPGSESGGTREVPDNETRHSPGRRSTDGDHGTTRATPDDENRGATSDRGQRRSRPSDSHPGTEPQSRPPREAPRASSPPQERPHAEPRPAPQQQPRSTGEPQLKRRRP